MDLVSNSAINPGEPRTLRLSSTFGFSSATLMVVLVLAGMPQLGIAVAIPWLSVVLVRRPGVLLATYLYIPFYKSVLLAYTPFDLTIWLALLCAAAVLIYAAKRGLVEVPVTTPLWLLLGVVMLVATATSIDIGQSLSRSVEFFVLTFTPLFLAIMVGRDRVFVCQFLRFTLGASVVFSVIGVYSLVFTDVGRLELSSNTIGAGRVAMMAVLLAPSVIPNTRSKPYLIAAITVLGLLAALATGSRGPLLAVAVSIFVVYAMWSKWFAYRALAFVGAGLMGVAILYSEWITNILPEGSLLRIRSLLDAVFGSAELDNSSSVRIELYAQALDMWAARPFTGMGPGSFEIVNLGNAYTPSHVYPHNAVLQAGAELGFIGVIVIVLIMFWALLNLFWQMHDPLVRGVATLMVFALFSAMLSNDLYDNRWMWGMLLLAGSLPLTRRSAFHDTGTRGQEGTGTYSP